MTILWHKAEIWRDVPGYEGKYLVSDTGKVQNQKGHQLQPRISNSGYPRVWLSTHGEVKSHALHRLVASAFLPNPTLLPEVNHLNGVKTDNRVENLEWCTVSHNRLHSQYVLQKESGKPKRRVICLTTGRTYPSVSEAARAVSGDKQNITNCCQGRRKHHRGLCWAYAEEVPHG